MIAQTRVRLIMPEDREAVLNLARLQVEETLPHLDFSPERVNATIDGALHRAEPTIFVAEHAGRVVGYLVAYLHGYAFTTGVYVSQEVLYVEPGYRGTRAAVRLIREFIRWGEMLDAREIIFGISNAFQPERTARLFERVAGAHRVGFILKRVP